MNNNVIISITFAKVRNNYLSAIKYKYYLFSLNLFLTYIKKIGYTLQCSQYH